MKELLAVTKALSDANRVRALLLLRGGELCLCQVVEMLGIAPSTVSKHMAVLHQAGLVESRKEGRWVHYRLPDPGAPALVRDAVRWVKECLARDPRAVADAKRLKVVRKMDLSDVCIRYRQ
jgi:DNA-binding transcriptional ArsR family regulator